MTGGFDKICVMVTRPKGQNDALCRLIESLGGKAVRFPVLEIRPVDRLELEENSLQSADWLIFVSANAVAHAVNRFRDEIRANTSARIAAVGLATAKALKKAGIRVDLTPKEGFNSEALLASAVLQQVSGLSCIIVRGEGGRELLSETLRERGADVKTLEVYRRNKPAVDEREIIRAFSADKPDIITVTSGEALRNLVELAGEKHQKILKSIPLVVISERIKQLALASGFNRVAVAAEPSDAAIVASVAEIMNEEYGE